MIKADEQVLKTDTLGRVKTPLARREQLLDEFEHSGLSGMKYATLVGIKYPTFASWLYKRRRGLDPYGYLRDVLSRLPSMTNRQIPEVTPEAWCRAHPVVL